MDIPFVCAHTAYSEQWICANSGTVRAACVLTDDVSDFKHPSAGEPPVHQEHVVTTHSGW